MTTAEVFSHLKSGARLDAYRIRGWKGGGAYGDVYEAVKDGRPVALKVSRHRLGSGDPARTDGRLLRELVCLVHLDHPHIAKVYGWARTRDGRGYLAMEYVDGWTLAEWLQKVGPTVQQVVRLFAKLAHAVEHMHDRRVRHRDLSPSNLMVRKVDGEPVIVDLGAGEYSGALELTDGPLPPGTHRYRSPEAIHFFKLHHDDAEARYPFPPEDDLYALAVCLYDALTDPEPTRHGDARQAPRIDVSSPTRPPPPAREANPRVPEALSGWLEKAMARELETRRAALASMRDVLEGLGAREDAEWRMHVQPPRDTDSTALDGVGASAVGTWRRVLAGAVAVAVVAASAYPWLREAPTPPAVPEHSSHPATPPSQVPASPPAPPASAVRSPAEVPPVEKEGPAVSAPVKPSKKSASTFSPRFLAKCAGATTLVAAQMGCPGPQVMPTRESCPASAVASMRAYGLDEEIDVDTILDVGQPHTGPRGKCEAAGRVYFYSQCLARVGDGVVESVTTHDSFGLPEGTRLYGRLWTGGEAVVGRYTRARTPEGEELEVCFFLSGTAGDKGARKEPGSKPGAAWVYPYQGAKIVYGQWP